MDDCAPRAAATAGSGTRWALVILLFGGAQRFRAVAAAALAAGCGIAIFLRIKKLPDAGVPAPSSRTAGPPCCRPTSSLSLRATPSRPSRSPCRLAVSIRSSLPGLLFCAISVAASRILLGMHFLSDVLAGARIGTVLAPCALRSCCKLLYSTGESLPSSARRTILTGGIALLQERVVEPCSVYCAPFICL